MSGPNCARSICYTLYNMAKSFLNESEQQLIIETIRQAELHTNGEIRLHIEAKCEGDAYDRAREVFYQLEMDKTAERSGVLFYIAYDDHKLAILGDKGIHEKVGQHFWQTEKDLLVDHFKNNLYAAGICKAIQDAGEKLSVHFPKSVNNPNELTNDISFGEGVKPE